MDERFYKEYLPSQMLRMNRLGFAGGYVPMTGDTESASRMHILLNDLPLGQMLSLTVAISEALQHAKPGSELLTLVPGPFHDLSLFCFDGQPIAEKIGRCLDRLGELQTKGKIRRGPVLLLPREAKFIWGYLNWASAQAGHAEYLCRTASSP